MVTLEDLAQRLGGVLRASPRRRWLVTTIGGLHVVVSRPRAPSAPAAYELAIVTPWTRELDPIHHLDADLSSGAWCLDDETVLPSLRPGFVFAGCRAGVLLARSVTEPTFEDVAGVLWELGAWARHRWRPVAEQVADRAARERRRRWRVRARRLAFVGAVVAVAVIVRRSPP